MVDIFISYAREDRGRAAGLARALRARGLDVWWEPDSLPAGQYAARIDALLAEAKAIIVIWTQHSISRAWVRDEAEFALKREVYVPVTFGPVSPPHGFEEFGAADLTFWPSPETEGVLDKLAGALAPLSEAPAPLPDEPDTPVLPHTTRKRRTALIIGGAFSALALAGAAITLFGPDLLRKPEEISTAQVEGPPGPGADQLYGFSESELTALAPHELITAALLKTNIDTIERDARGGDRLGRTLLCLSRAYGEGLPKNIFIARQTCEAAAEAGDALAIYQLSLFMRAGEGGYTESTREADRELQRAADAGDPRALTDRARVALEKNKAQDALPLLERAAEIGYRPSFVLLAQLHEQSGDLGAAREWYQRAAEAGDREAAGRLALLAPIEAGPAAAAEEPDLRPALAPEDASPPPTPADSAASEAPNPPVP